MKTNKILIVADDSPSAVRAIEYGFNLAREVGARVALLYVIEAALAEGNVDAGIFPDQAAAGLTADAEAFLQHMQQRYGEGIDTEQMTPEGDIRKIAIEMAQAWQAQLMIMGTHGRTGLNKLLMGSVTDSVLHDSPVPVCIVPNV
ncbi:universal stress protein [Mucilaginibacter robiniae]|uniref:Universal stress protein n=1 Tax=Mucilaginibacter robiniae TaxID=2728022 RepID=A0A7L5DYG6_9SPHI|nr:universal stress protein [Mucilaginibacter robiniae]QJD96055.1 universal stress protein [Mucilaginibacter robiniae]